MSKSLEQSKALDKSKATVANAVKTTGRIVNNAEKLVISVSLLVVTVFAFTHLKEVTNQSWRYTVAFCLAVVGLYAFAQLVQFLNKGDN